MKTQTIRQTTFLILTLGFFFNSGFVSAKTQDPSKHPTIQSFSAGGKLSYRHDKKGGTASFHWQEKSPDHYQIRLYGALGSGSIQIIGEPGHVHLKQSNGKVVTAKTPESLVKKELGWDIPISGLRYWLLGIPAPHIKPTKTQYDRHGRLVLLVDSGWTIRYHSYRKIGTRELPEKITLDNGKSHMKLIFQQWHIPKS